MLAKMFVPIFFISLLLHFQFRGLAQTDDVSSFPYRCGYQSDFIPRLYVERWVGEGIKFDHAYYSGEK